ncbi:MAG: hypothetical protein QOE48_745 [Mycobacterium sp.]|nr:hypothetical protein [Mycobacterium sp.]MDT5305077.1 hypothetical protein [Mycobacterium sp.]
MNQDDNGGSNQTPNQDDNGGSNLTPNQGSNGGSNQTPKQDPFTLDVFLKVASFCGVVIYGVLFIGYRTYFHELGITPEDVGVGSTFVLVRSIGFIALAIGAVALVLSIVFVLDQMAKRSMENQPVTENPVKQRLKYLWQWSWNKQSVPWVLALAFWAVLLLIYLLALKPWSWPVCWIVGVWIVLLAVAFVVMIVAGLQDPAVGLGIVTAISIVISVILPGIFVYFRAHDLADSALRSTVVKPYSILFGSIPVLDVSSDEVDVEWVCDEKTKKPPSVFHGGYTSKGELLGEDPSSVFVRMDPEGKATIVKLPAECVVTTRHRDIPATHG